MAPVGQGAGGQGFGAFQLKLRQLLLSVQKMALAAGIGIYRYWPKPPASNVLALTISDVLLRKVLECRGTPSDFTFIQIGANDGLTNDPLRRLILKYGFRGLLVEPQPGPFSRLVKNYSGRPGLAFENAAIAPMDGEATLYRFRPGAGVPAWADCLASFSREHLISNFDNVKGEVEEITVPAMTFRTLLEKHRLATVDLLQIDTEGFDYEIIKMIDFQSFKPAIINFEQLLLLGSVRQECYAHLGRQGYKITESGVDAVAYLEPPEQALPETGVPVE